MTNNELISLLQKDLENERKHLAFYLQASTMVCGLHREELREFLLEEAQSELKHVEEFSELIVHLGGVPGTGISDYPAGLSCPVSILKYVVEMEQEVADIYALRLRQTDNMDTTATAYAHVFYEDQIRDSQRTAWEVAKMIKHHEHV
jgi:bacterioferritin